MNALSRDNLMRVYSSEQSFDEVYMIQFMQRLLKAVEEDVAELINIHLNKYFYHGLIVVSFDSFAERDRV
jgi:hypothetical protein